MSTPQKIFSSKEIIDMTIAGFKRVIKPTPTEEGEEVSEVEFTTLEKYRKVLKRYINKYAESDTHKSGVNQIKKKFAALEHVMKKRTKAGVMGRRRVAGTGERKEVTLKYKDTASNRAQRRVGEEYTRVTWEGSEFEEYKRNIRTKKRKKVGPRDPNKPANTWIKAFTKAKSEFPEIAPNTWVAPKKVVTDPSNAQEVLQNRVYLRAMEIMAEEKMANKEVVVEEVVVQEESAPIAMEM